MRRRVYLFAPNVHVGGGLVLLQSLLDALPQNAEIFPFLDARARASLSVDSALDVHWSKRGVAGRLRAERALRRRVVSGDLVLCFHNVPPVFPLRGAVKLFLQNALLIDGSTLAGLAWKTRLRIWLERRFLSMMIRRVDAVVVQTGTMRAAFRAWGGRQAEAVPVIVAPFIEACGALEPDQANGRTFDFLYVADVQRHKNHETLLAAWELLASEGLSPSLALTLHREDLGTLGPAFEAAQAAGANIALLGKMSHAQVRQLYVGARALVYPSLSESFGMPLIEAAHQRLPIVASERDYVRDVCVPAETFDPLSARSIARAVRRFLGSGSSPEPIGSASIFWARVLEGTEEAGLERGRSEAASFDG